jgi:hypothetical protein
VQVGSAAGQRGAQLTALQRVQLTIQSRRATA